MTTSTASIETTRVLDDAAFEAANDELAILAGHLNAVNARLVAATEGLLETTAWQQGGVRSPSAFLQWKLGLSPARADDVDRSGRPRRAGASGGSREVLAELLCKNFTRSSSVAVHVGGPR